MQPPPPSLTVNGVMVCMRAVFSAGTERAQIFSDNNVFRTMPFIDDLNLQ